MSCRVCILQHGNRWFQAQQYQAAAEAYSQALMLQAADNSLNLALLCNRAAAHHCQGQHLDAVFDCSLALQLDPSSCKALQVRCSPAVQPVHRGWRTRLRQLPNLRTNETRKENAACSGDHGMSSIALS